jgi:hypothetical protein
MWLLGLEKIYRDATKWNYRTGKDLQGHHTMELP